jgi:thiol-disulfide isomerase/thioredoxin
MTAMRLPVEGELPALDGATGWLNTPPLSPEDLSGKVVVADFWTYTCVNWLRQLPYVRAWAEKYSAQGLVVLGVHTPEFSFEHDIDNVRRAVTEMGITYPVAIDNDYAIWGAFQNHYWPALYFADVHGMIRHHHYGEGEYEQSEMVIQQLLADAGSSPDRALVRVEPRGAEVAADWASLRSGENYAGYERTENFASPGGALPGRPHVYETPGRLSLNDWALSGDWTVGAEAATLNAPGGQITSRFHGRDLNLVMGPAERGSALHYRVLLDGQPPGNAHGSDTDEQGYGTLAEQRLHQLIRQPGPIADRTVEISFPEAGAQAYAFTFG